MENKLIYQKNCFIRVKAIHGGKLLAEATLVGTEIEASGRLMTDKKTLEIKEACWEIYRSPGNKLNGREQVPGLEGVKAYFQCGGDLRRVVGEQAGGLAREMLAECVRGIIQAETFLYKERGYSTLEDYGDYWKKNYAGACRYYSNLDRVSLKWNDYVQDFYRGKNIFSRAKGCSIFRGAGGLNAFGTFSDSFHEIGVNLQVSETGRLTACAGNYLRAPDRVCYENASALAALEGIHLPQYGKKEIARFIGGPQGCDHLVDLVYDLKKAVESVPAGSEGKGD